MIDMTLSELLTGLDLSDDNDPPLVVVTKSTGRLAIGDAVIIPIPSGMRVGTYVVDHGKDDPQQETGAAPE